MEPVFSIIGSDVVSKYENIKTAETAGNRIFPTKAANLIILLTGSSITLVLLVLIFNTIRRHQSLVKNNRNELALQNVHGIESIYYELNINGGMI